MSKPAVLVVTDKGDLPETGLFIALHGAGVRIKVLGRSDSPQGAWLEDAGVPFEALALTRKRDFAGTETIRWHIDDFRPQILHLVRKQQIFNGLAAAKGRPLRIVLCREIAGNPNLLNPLDWVSFLNPRVDRIVCAAEAVRRGLIDLGIRPFKLSPQKLVTIHQGHDVRWYRAPPLDLALLGVPKSAFIVNCVANVRPGMGIPVLIRACDHLPPDLPIHFLLVGRGMSSPRITRLIDRSAYRDRFHVLGFRDDAPQIMAASHVSVLPSLRREGLPRSIIESMVYETTPVVSDAGGNPELVEHERSGLVVPAGDARALSAALLRLFCDRQTCAALGRNARLRILREFTVEKTAAKMLAMYRGLGAA